MCPSEAFATSFRGARLPKGEAANGGFLQFNGHREAEQAGSPRDTELVMKIAIFGLGYVGLTAAACLVRQGHSVCGVDIDRNKTEAVGAGRSPIKEPGLQELLAEGVGKQLLTTANDGSAAAAAADAVMICVGTPSTPDGAHNMDHVVKVTREIAEALEADPACSPTLIYRSTFRPGTTEGLILPILRAALGESRMDGIEVVHNPEFLRESTAIRDYFNPPKIVVGTSHGGPSPAMDRLYQGIAAPVFHTPYRVSELIKLVDNTWHATKVAFANEMGRIAINLGLDPGTIHQLFVADTKLNISATYLRPGGPFGGSCLPKDVKALQQIALDAGASTTLIDSLVRSNDAHKYFVF
jgi:GDP-mannose 6-dehydrogenase